VLAHPATRSRAKLDQSLSGLIQWNVVMRRLRQIFLFAIAFASLTRTAWAAEQCPTYAGKDTIALLQNAPTCKEANKLLGLCSWNTSMDVQFSQIVIDKCEKNFLSSLPASRLAKYKRERAACIRKYANEHGTMYVSFSATCQADVAAKFSRK
jgi:hypothetical protein